MAERLIKFSLVPIAWSSSSSSQRISTLGHESFDNSMEISVIVESQLGQVHSASGMHWSYPVVQFEFHISIVSLDVPEVLLALFKLNLVRFR